MSGENTYKKEDMTHLALFTNNDPISYVEAVKSENWRREMDAEVEAIEMNDT